MADPGLWGGYKENGRLFHSFSKGKYFLPCDEDEQDRLDIYHKFFNVARHDVLHSTPFTAPFAGATSHSKFGAKGPLILDLGTGTGIWAIDVADKYVMMQAKVYGVDLAWTQPQIIPANVSFLQGDIDSPWRGLGEDSWDLIHMRMLNGGIMDWKEVYQKVFRHLKPGHGWLEHTEIDIFPRCDDGSLPANSALMQWTKLVLEATEEAGRPLRYNTSTGSMLAHAGLVDIREQVIQVPLNPWPTDPHLKEIGRWYNLGFSQGIQASALAPLTRVKGWSVGRVNNLCNEVRKEICSKKYHVYHNIHIWNARRPTL
ncbi:BgTH12-06113 [Blumeria graminis f. sp. triticale]|uniref:BgtA-20067 n=3 Tax=Blumeria graminis TaxID=34373 RepID=A0A9X9QEN2_BLUGR|nr:hypothetical protein BGT96224_A20067 [Blumeria graminis f. sp. tritici 96224]CAD6504383.1 BgTH12-06113 [Blumeria graminis f. sp. triticale]VDB91209.1 BgtA-20067 [Blumeria graminis f. sp. tritici]